MMNHLEQNLIRNGCNVGASLCTVDHMDRVADACGDDLGLDSVHLEDFGDVLNQGDSRSGDVVETAKKRRYIVSAGAGGEEC